MSGDNAFDALDQCYQRLLATCDALESLADALPGPVSADQCQKLADDAITLVAETHRLEEQVLLPLLATSTRRELYKVAERLRQEHAFDSQAALEIEEALTGLVSGRPILSADATGYLLRSFFESVRRHVHAEQDLLMLITDRNSTGRSLH